MTYLGHWRMKLGFEQFCRSFHPLCENIVRETLARTFLEDPAKVTGADAKLVRYGDETGFPIDGFVNIFANAIDECAVDLPISFGSARIKKF